MAPNIHIRSLKASIGLSHGKHGTYWSHLSEFVLGEIGEFDIDLSVREGFPVFGEDLLILLCPYDSFNGVHRQSHAFVPGKGRGSHVLTVELLEVEGVQHNHDAVFVAVFVHGILLEEILPLFLKGLELDHEAVFRPDLEGQLFDHELELFYLFDDLLQKGGIAR